MIVFERVAGEGFGSFVNKTEFILDSVGLNIIRGKIGVGKTTVPSLLYWVIYGITLKPKATVQTWEELRTNKFKGTYGQVDFSISKDKYSIIRCISYKGVVFDKQKGGSKIIIIKNGKELIPRGKKGKKNIQELINSIIGYSPELFINTIIYGQRLKRLVEESGPNKKKLFDEAFETMFIQKAKTKASEELRETNFLWGELTNRKQDIEEQLEDVWGTIKDLKELGKNFEKNKKKQIKELKEELEEIEIKRSNITHDIKSIKNIGGKSRLEKSIKALEQLQEKNLDDLKLHDQYKATYEKYKDKTDNLREERAKLKAKKCPTCGGKLNESKANKAKAEINDEIAKYDIIKQNMVNNIKNLPALVDLNRLKDKYKNKLTKYNKELLELKSKTREKELLDKEFNWLLKKETKIVSKIKDLEKSKYEDKTAKYIKKEKTLSIQLKETKAELSKIETEVQTLKWLIKEPLSDSGIKAYIFNNLLTQVNDSLKQYAEVLGFRVEFGIDMETASKDFYQVIYKGDLIINYPDLSGGQKQITDNTIALAFHDVISSVKPTNLLFLDEPFEGLDPDTVDIMADLISMKSRDKSLFLITHHPTFNPTNSKTIYFSLDKYGNTIID